jgi:hypothetical protein
MSADWKAMWVHVADNSKRARRSLRERANRREATWVLIPIGDSLVLLSSHPIDDERADPVDVWIERVGVVTEALERKAGGNLSSSDDINLTGEGEQFEAYRRTPHDRCWHTHLTRFDAAACAETKRKAEPALGNWLVRPFSGRYALGRLRIVSGDEIRRLLDLVEIAHTRDLDERGLERLEEGDWNAARPPQDTIRLEPIRWDDHRFTYFRDSAGWRPPGQVGAHWQPPPFLLTVAITTSGDLPAQITQEAS